MPLLRKIARQKYLEEREEKKLRELQDAIDDEEYGLRPLTKPSSRHTRAHTHTLHTHRHAHTGTHTQARTHAHADGC